MLKRITRYNDFGDSPLSHRDIILFWEVLGSFTQEQLSSYLKYVWGRARLSHGISDIHQVTFKRDTSGIPETHTCFFEIDIGTYPDAADLKKKLLYGMENCKEIAETSRDYQLAADFGMD